MVEYESCQPDDSNCAGAKVITFFLTFGSLLGHVQPTTLFNVAESNASYAPYLLMTLPFCLASFGYHGNVPSLMKHYGKDPKTIVKCPGTVC